MCQHTVQGSGPNNVCARTEPGEPRREHEQLLARERAISGKDAHGAARALADDDLREVPRRRGRAAPWLGCIVHRHLEHAPDVRGVLEYLAAVARREQLALARNRPLQVWKGDLVQGASEPDGELRLGPTRIARRGVDPQAVGAGPGARVLLIGYHERVCARNARRLNAGFTPSWGRGGFGRGAYRRFTSFKRTQTVAD